LGKGSSPLGDGHGAANGESVNLLGLGEFADLPHDTVVAVEHVTEDTASSRVTDENKRRVRVEAKQREIAKRLEILGPNGGVDEEAARRSGDAE